MNYRNEDETPVGAVIGGVSGGLVLTTVIVVISIAFFWRRCYLSAKFKVRIIFGDNNNYNYAGFQ